MHVLFTTIPAAQAKPLVRQLLELRLIACGNILQGAQSLYWWNGEIQEEEESVIIMETTDEQVEDARLALMDFHPYDVPKILTLEPSSANEAYVEWLKKEVQS
ncbi:MAG: divalent-cation tolerance protein CutA [Deltaproteobacteria bacterium]|nr:divalent-cation tolerance protein CutA [Deltaproteobacteria bacterium]